MNKGIYLPISSRLLLTSVGGEGEATPCSYTVRVSVAQHKTGTRLGKPRSEESFKKLMMIVNTSSARIVPGRLRPRICRRPPSTTPQYTGPPSITLQDTDPPHCKAPTRWGPEHDYPLTRQPDPTWPWPNLATNRALELMMTSQSHLRWDSQTVKARGSQIWNPSKTVNSLEQTFGEGSWRRGRTAASCAGDLESNPSADLWISRPAPI